MSETDETERGASGRLDVVAGAVLAALSLGLFFWFVPTFAPGAGGPGQIAPSFFPRLAIAVVFVCALIVTVANLGALRRPSTGAGGRLLTEFGGWCLFAVVLFVLLRFAGFVPAGVYAVLCGTLLTRYRRRPILVGLIAIGLPLLLDWGAWSLFLVELP